MRKGSDIAVEGFLFFSVLISAVLTISVFVFMLIFGLPLLTEGRLFSLVTDTWRPGNGFYGIQPMIAGTLLISSLSVIIAFPVSMGCTFLITVLAPGPFAAFLKKTVQLMTGIPTVIYGFVGIFLLVPFIREFFQKGSGMCILTASLMLALLIAPTMILFFADSFERVPLSYLRAVDALGGTPVQKLLYVFLPCARSGIWSGVILALGRALGDTLIALMLAGNAVQMPGSLSDSARTLTAHIALVIAADYDSPEFRSVFACGMVLYLFTVIEVIILRTLARGRKAD
ncbi:MAG: phosphate ABC transporter permease subunit PstC [Desulfobacterales bacterium]